MKISTLLIAVLAILSTFAISAVAQKRQKASAEIPFAERADRFWKWFGKNSPKMDKLLKKKDGLYKINDLMYEGTRIIGNDVCYNIGNSSEFSFSIEGQSENLYLYPWLVASIPDSLLTNWTVYPCKQPDPSVVNTGFCMFDKEIDIADIMVAADYDKDKGNFVIYYYHPEFVGLSEEESMHAFTLILELLIGEGAFHNYVRDIRQKDSDDGMINIANLADTMKILIENSGKEYHVKPLLPLYGYSGNPNPESTQMRSDIIAGSSQYMALIEEYLNGEQKIYDSLKRKGATALMLIITQPEGMLTDDFIELRYRVEDYLISLFDSRTLKGILTGGAYGASGLGYIDLILFDTDGFLRHISNDKTLRAILTPAAEGSAPLHLMYKTFAIDSPVHPLPL